MTAKAKKGEQWRGTTQSTEEENVQLYRSKRAMRARPPTTPPAKRRRRGHGVFPLSTNASAFSPDPHHALVETGATQQGFIVCVKGSFGFICLLSGQSPDDLFFHISALEQVRGVKREVPKRKHWGEGVLSHCALCVWHRGDVDRGGEGLSRVGGHESFLQAVALHLLCGNVV